MPPSLPRRVFAPILPFKVCPPAPCQYLLATASSVFLRSLQNRHFKSFPGKPPPGTPTNIGRPHRVPCEERQLPYSVDPGKSVKGNNPETGTPYARQTRHPGELGLRRHPKGGCFVIQGGGMKSPAWPFC
jgi:hypothetical protein